MTQVRAARAIALSMALFGLIATVNADNAPVTGPDVDLGFYGDSREVTLAHIKRVGLMPVILPSGIVMSAELKASIEATVVTYLQKAGLEVVPSSTYTQSFNRFSKQIGGIYDPQTGAARSAQLGAVAENARREFVDDQRLDGLAYIRLIMTKATFDPSWARWDSVKERPNGRHSHALGLFKGTGNSTGVLPAYSLLLQIVNPDNRVVFGREGGIQLGMYFDPAHKIDGNDMLPVPFSELFHDPQRIERATRVATQTLIYSREQIAAGLKDPAINAELVDPDDLPALPEGALPKPADPLKVPREQILANVHRVAIAPINRGEFTLPDGMAARYTELIKTELRALGWDPVQADNATTQYITAFRNAGPLFDPLTGQADSDRIKAIRKSIFPQLGITPPPDAILWVGLKRSVVEQNNGDVFWDGVDENALTMQPVKKGQLLGNSARVAAGSGGISAVSLAVELLDADATVLYQSQGGIQLLQKLNIATKVLGGRITYDATPTNLAPTELFQDDTREAPAVHVALRNLTLTPAQLQAELHPGAAAAH